MDLALFNCLLWPISFVGEWLRLWQECLVEFFVTLMAFLSNDFEIISAGDKNIYTRKRTNVNIFLTCSWQFRNWPCGYKTGVQSQTQNKVQWLAACGHVSTSSQSLCFILILRLNSSFITSRPEYTSTKGTIKSTDETGNLFYLFRFTMAPWKIIQFLEHTVERIHRE